MDSAVGHLRRALAASSEAERRLAHREFADGTPLLLDEAEVAGLTPSAVLVPLLVEGGAPRILLTRRADHLRSHQGQVSFPGGRRDPEDDSLRAAALREAHEEVGLPPSQVEVLGYLDDQLTMSGYRMTPVVGVVRGAFEPVFDAGEVAEVFELPLAALLDEDFFLRRTFDRNGAEVSYWELRHGPQLIWGATAEVLWELRGILVGSSGT